MGRNERVINPKRNNLSNGEVIKLHPLITESYTASRMSDTEFAVMAAARLGFGITGSNVAALRRELGIEPNFKPGPTKPRDGDYSAVLSLIEEQSKAIAILWRAVNELKGGKLGDAPATPQFTLNLSSGEVSH
jgi:hypothetical protein